jgi:outer membrane receptor protein involved in Fe transport
MSKRVVAAARVASGVLCLTAIAAAAQQAAAPAGDASSSASSSGELQQIVVTAQKRKEDIRKVPLSVSVLSAEQLEAKQVTDFTDLTRNVPNISFQSQAGAGLSTLEMRGVSSQAGSATVSIYLDDVSLTTRNLYSQGTAEPRFFDVERVEVLRGPQGTLYGASSLGGTIKFISKQPDPKHFGGEASASVSSTSHGGTNYEVQAVVNVPLIQGSTALRVGVQSGHESGYIDQVDYKTLQVTAKGINSTRWDVVKASLKADLGNGWTLLPSVFAQEYHSDDIDASYLRVGSPDADYQIDSPLVGQPLGIFQTSKQVREPGKDRLVVPSLTVNGDLGFADFTGILSGYTRRFSRTQDGTQVNSAFIGDVIRYGNDSGSSDPAKLGRDATPNPALGDVVGALPSYVYLDNKIDQTAVELRMASKDFDPARSSLTWVGGVYFAQTKTQVYDNEPVVGINAAFANAGKDITNPNDIADAFVNDFPGDNSYFSARHYNDKQSSVFGEATYHLSSALRASAGVRLLEASQTFTREGDYYFAGGPTESHPPEAKWHAVTPRFTLDWDASKEVTVYGNIAKGFRLGSANRPVPLTGAVQADLTTLHLPGTIPVAYNPDSLWSYEVGAKTRLLDNKLLFNVAAFYLDWKDIQQDVTLPTSGYDFETNAGRAKSYGLELDGRLRVNEGLTLTGALGVTRAVFAEDVPALGFYDSGDLHVHSGDRVQGVPNYSANLGFDYHFALAADYSAFIRGNGQWTGTSRGSLVADRPDYERPAYFTADASAGVNFDRWTFTMFVKNLTNTQTIIQQPSIQSVVQAYRLRPRTIGLTASADF